MHKLCFMYKDITIDKCIVHTYIKNIYMLLTLYIIDVSDIYVHTYIDMHNI